MQKQIKKLLLIALGWISLSLGFLGIFLPILPTTPFILLASWAFYRSSDKFYAWLTKHKLFRKYLDYYRTKQGMPLRAKIITILLLHISIFSTVYFHNFHHILEIALVGIAILVTIYLIKLKIIPD